MTDENARFLASEYNLEFVDLDGYNLDPGAATILPADVARRHHVVPVGRKFGAPVIAIADPGDVVAMDALRLSIAREFISVVASNRQIDACLERVYGGAGDGACESANGNGSQAPVADPAPAVGPEDPLSAALDDALTASMFGSTPAAPPAEVPDATPLPAFEPPAAPGPVDGVGVVDLTEEIHAVEAALAYEPPPPPPVPAEDDVALAADLVEEAVAEFEHAGGEPVLPEATSGALANFPPLARVLVEGGRVTEHDMESALEEHDASGQTLARVLTSRSLVTEADLMWGMAKEMGLEFVDLENRNLNYSAAFSVPEATARHHNVVVVDQVEGVAVVAASNPTDVFAMDDLRTIVGRNFRIVVATRSQINAYIDKVYHQGGDAEAVAQTAAMDIGDTIEEELSNLQSVVDDAPIVRYVNLLVLQGLNERASDIHVEPTAENLRIRYRIDGVLHDMSTAPRAIASAVVTRLKVMAEMNIAEHRVPQDGRISLSLGNRAVDLRVATLPTIYGEKVVMRVLDKSNVILSFEELGFDPEFLDTFGSLYSKPYGTILVTGPTGSGKTTTLYATLSALNHPEKNIITVEDPVELRIKGINQVQLNVRAGLTFASALRSILRSDPDIVLVGEIRDKETAVISIEAALTGHLVLATLHTNDAASTPMRLVEMGLEPYLVTSAVSGALAQRLTRRLCMSCKEPYDATEADIAAAGWAPEEVFASGTGTIKLYRSVGCPACSQTGYRGRRALIELLVMTDEIERLIIEGGSADDIHRLSVEQGMVTLRQAGLRKALEGETTLEEILRVVA